ncbi:unnamed protein product [Ectocarpus sp. 12 AP-2014]
MTLRKCVNLTLVPDTGHTQRLRATRYNTHAKNKQVKNMVLLCHQITNYRCFGRSGSKTTKHATILEGKPRKTMRQAASLGLYAKRHSRELLSLPHHKGGTSLLCLVRPDKEKKGATQTESQQGPGKEKKGATQTESQQQRTEPHRKNTYENYSSIIR